MRTSEAEGRGKRANEAVVDPSDAKRTKSCINENRELEGPNESILVNDKDVFDGLKETTNLNTEGGDSEKLHELVPVRANDVEDSNETGYAEKTRDFKGPHEFVLVERGNLPLIVSVPHGGTWSPEFLPDQAGVTDSDHNTMPLALKTIEHIKALTGGQRPYSVMLGLHRKKLDVNRDKGFKCPSRLAQQVWEQYHGAIEVAIEECRLRFGGCHLIDIHGTGHYYSGVTPKRYIEYVEIGYGLSRQTLALDDSNLDAKVCTFKLGNGLDGVRTSEVVRGKYSLGAFLEKAGLPGGAVPSNSPDRMCVPEKVNAFFSGGGTTVSGRHTKPDFVTTSQMEFPHGLRFSDRRSERFSTYAEHFAQGVLDYVRHWFGPGLARRLCVVKSPTLLHESLDYTDPTSAPMLTQGEVCRFVEEGEGLQPCTGVATRRIRLVTPMCGWVDKDCKNLNFEKGTCSVKSKTVALRREIDFSSEKLKDLLTQGTVCHWVAEGKAQTDGGNTIQRVRVVANDGSIVGWGNKELFDFM